VYEGVVSIRDFLQQPAKRHPRIELPDWFDPDFLRPMRVGPCFVTSGRSILRSDGEFVLVHAADFAENILMGENCFLCGCYPDGMEFNNEHVIPDWLLRYTGIANMSITLPNGHLVRYSSYKVRSCKQCNSFLAENIEGPISKAMKGGFKTFSNFLENNRKLVFQWLCLLYYKVHFRDFSYRYNLDRRESDISIGALYAWPNFHHIFCVARSVIFDAQFSNGVIGTIKIFQLNDWERHGKFDYRDHWISDTLFIRLKDICIYVSFTDAGAVKCMTQDKFARVPQHLNHIQAIEIYGDFISAKMHFKRQHDFHSFYDPDADFLQIIAEISSDFGWQDLDPSIRGSAQVLAFQPEFGNFKMDDLSPEETYNEIALGESTFFPLEGGGEFGYIYNRPPDDPEHAKKVSMQVLEKETVRNAIRTLTKDYFEEE
jgi:hypothetical protein